MTQTFETPTLHINESQLMRELPNPYGNEQLANCDAAGSQDPTVAIYVTPQGDFKISETRHEFGSIEQRQLSHTLGAIAVDTLPLDALPTQLRTVA